VENKIAKIEVIGSGCASCKKLYELAVRVSKDLNIGVEVEYSDDVQKGVLMGAMQFPVLAVNGKAVLTGSSDLEKVKKALKDQSGGEDISECCPCGGDCGCL